VRSQFGPGNICEIAKHIGQMLVGNPVLHIDRPGDSGMAAFAASTANSDIRPNVQPRVQIVLGVGIHGRNQQAHGQGDGEPSGIATSNTAGKAPQQPDSDKPQRGVQRGQVSLPERASSSGNSAIAAGQLQPQDTPDRCAATRRFRVARIRARQGWS